MAFLQINSALRLDITDDYCGVTSSIPLRVLSSAILNGGLQDAQSWLNLRVSGEHHDGHPAESLKGVADSLGWPGPVIGMMTAASMDSCRMRYTSHHGISVLCVATSGLQNARRIGDAADATAWEDHRWRPGTINVALFTNASLTPAALVEAIQLISEAKTAACHDGDVTSPVSGLIATGTGTDATAVFCDPAGPTIEFCGKHLLLGELIGSLAYDVVLQGIQACQRVAARQAEQHKGPPPEQSADPASPPDPAPAQS
jgi:adenosylcobinamide amidohydrolase